MTETFTLSLGLAVPVAQLEAWLKDAAPGAREVYASGIDLPRGEPAVALVRRWQDAGLVALTSTRDPADRRRTNWLVIKSGNPVARIDDSPASERTARTQREMVQLLDVLRDAAAKRVECPSDRLLARILGLGGDVRGWKRANYLLGVLKADGAIAVECRGRNAARVVTIRAKGRACGRSTARSGEGNHG